PANDAPAAVNDAVRAATAAYAWKFRNFGSWELGVGNWGVGSWELGGGNSLGRKAGGGPRLFQGRERLFHFLTRRFALVIIEGGAESLDRLLERPHLRQPQGRR